MKQLLYLMPIISGAMWGSAGIFVRKLTELGMNSYTVVSVRVVLAVLILAVWLGIYDKDLLKIKLKDLWIFVAGGVVGMFGLNICYNFAISELSLSLAAVLLSLSPVFVLFMAAILFKEKITSKKVICMTIAIAGCVLASGVLEAASTMRWSVKGIIVGTIGAFFYGLYGIISKTAMERGYHAFTTTFYCLFMVMLVVIPLTNWKLVTDVVVANPVKMSVFLVIHSLCTSVLPYILYTFSIRYIDAGMASILASGEPVAAMIFGVIFFSEIPTVLSVVGIVLVIVALALLSMPKKIK
ncbi:EamA family transporter [Peptacetobacter hiranonis]|uniref:DMT family transporter n=1 Tax=Peptacetobacter hiranonis TaxID=89152 RepID=UPI0019170E7F|nr:DMT family transporter [Peptacetobacter hiranonis]QQQ86445.1 EamA family transporter [Peptacetobacter hiranonis]